MAFPQYTSKTFFWPTGKNDKITPKCHAIIFKNTGDRPCTINNLWRLEPGEESPTISTGHPEVIDMTEYKITFDTGGGGVAPMVVAIYTQTRPAISNVNPQDVCEKL